MKLSMKRSNAVEWIAALFILLFVYTGVSKLLSLDALNHVLKDYPFVNKFPILTAWGVPLAELLIAIILYIPRTRLIGLYASLVSMVLFTMYLIYMLIYVPKLPCTCGGILQKLTWPQHLIFNVFCIVLSIVGIILYRRKKRLTANEAIRHSNKVVFS